MRLLSQLRKNIATQEKKFHVAPLKSWTKTIHFYLNTE